MFRCPCGSIEVDVTSGQRTARPIAGTVERRGGRPWVDSTHTRMTTTTSTTTTTTHDHEHEHEHDARHDDHDRRTTTTTSTSIGTSGTTRGTRRAGCASTCSSGSSARTTGWPTPTATTSASAGVRVVNVMSSPGAGKTTLLAKVFERAGSHAVRRDRGRHRDRDRRRPARGHRRRGLAREHLERVRRRVPPRRPDGALGAAAPAARRPRRRGDRERRQPRVPGRVRRRRGRPPDGVLDHRGRGEAAQVPGDVPVGRCDRRQQDGSAAAPRLRPRAVPRQRRGREPGCDGDPHQRPHRRRRRRRPRLAASARDGMGQTTYRHGRRDGVV